MRDMEIFFNILALGPAGAGSVNRHYNIDGHVSTFSFCFFIIHEHDPFPSIISIVKNIYFVLSENYRSLFICFLSFHTERSFSKSVYSIKSFA